ncbi:MAG: LysR family transcriptional regulator [Burkholderiales bacterium]|nr:LysR family transcriptional regulator [Burkholderiales bacterium]
MRLDFFTLKLFVAVSEEKSIARAAAREHVVASAASKRLAQLESDLGASLLVRHAKGVELTPAGVALLARARDILRSVETTEREIADFGADGSAQLTLAANHSALVQFLPGDLAAYAARHPRTRIELSERYSVDVTRAVADGLADVGVFCSPVSPRGLATLPYRRDELVLVVPRGHALAKRRRIAFADAAACEFIGYFPTPSVDSVYPAVASRVRSRVRIRIANFDATCRMAKAGLGIALLPLGSAGPHLADGELVALRLTDRWVHRRLRVCVRAGTAAARGARDLAEFLSARARSRSA